MIYFMADNTIKKYCEDQQFDNCNLDANEKKNKSLSLLKPFKTFKTKTQHIQLIRTYTRPSQKLREADDDVLYLRIIFREVVDRLESFCCDQIGDRTSLDS